MPADRLRQVGAEGLSDAELLAVLLGPSSGAGGRAEPALIRATRLLQAHGSLHALAERGIGALTAAPGIGEATAARLVAAQELGRRLLAAPWNPSAPITSSEQVVAALGPRMVHLDHERVVALALDARSRLRAEITVGVGGQSGCALSPSDLLRRLLLEGAAAAILVHNHPSGDPSPSASDLTFTQRLAEAFEVVGLELLDHVILGREGHFSFLDCGILPGAEGPGGLAKAADSDLRPSP